MAATVTDFIQSLQNAKKAQSSWAQSSLADRISAVEKTVQQLEIMTGKIVDSESVSQSLPRDFIQDVTIQRSKTVLQEVLQQLQTVRENEFLRYQATGIISVLLPAPLSFRFAMEMIVPALAAGNAVLVKASSLSPETAELVTELFQHFPAGLVTALKAGREELGELFVGHPSLKAVAFCGNMANGEKIAAKALSGFKKLKLYMSGNNSALVLDGADLNQVSQELVESCFLGGGRLRESISKILVLESRLEEFLSAFQIATQNFLHKHQLQLSLKDQERLNQIVNMIPEESGKVVFGGKGEPLIVKDLSHCSTLQQDTLAAPVALVSAVKYQHEMLKWANTGYLGVCAQVFGPSEKIPKVAAKLEAAQIYANSWLRQYPALGWGQKSSAFGIEDSQVFGSFFSERKNFVGT